jgi:hypothetical protein
MVIPFISPEDIAEQLKDSSIGAVCCFFGVYEECGAKVLKRINMFRKNINV